MFLLLLLPIELNLIEWDILGFHSYLSGNQVSVARNITSGMIIRPLLFLTLYIFISINLLCKRNTNV